MFTPRADNDRYLVHADGHIGSLLIRRGNEWHAPNRSVLNTPYIIVIEPVTAGSKVAELIAALKRKNP